MKSQHYHNIPKVEDPQSSSSKVNEKKLNNIDKEVADVIIREVVTGFNIKEEVLDGDLSEEEIDECLKFESEEYNDLEAEFRKTETELDDDVFTTLSPHPIPIPINQKHDQSLSTIPTNSNSVSNFIRRLRQKERRRPQPLCIKCLPKGQAFKQIFSKQVPKPIEIKEEKSTNDSLILKKDETQEPKPIQIKEEETSSYAQDVPNAINSITKQEILKKNSFIALIDETKTGADQMQDTPANRKNRQAFREAERSLVVRLENKRIGQKSEKQLDDEQGDLNKTQLIPLTSKHPANKRNTQKSKMMTIEELINSMLRAAQIETQNVRNKSKGIKRKALDSDDYNLRSLRTKSARRARNNGLEDRNKTVKCLASGQLVVNSQLRTVKSHQIKLRTKRGGGAARNKYQSKLLKTQKYKSKASEKKNKNKIIVSQNRINMDQARKRKTSKPQGSVKEIVVNNAKQKDKNTNFLRPSQITLNNNNQPILTEDQSNTTIVPVHVPIINTNKAATRRDLDQNQPIQEEHSYCLSAFVQGLINKGQLSKTCTSLGFNPLKIKKKQSRSRNKNINSVSRLVQFEDKNQSTVFGTKKMRGPKNQSTKNKTALRTSQIKNQSRQLRKKKNPVHKPILHNKHNAAINCDLNQNKTNINKNSLTPIQEITGIAESQNNKDQLRHTRIHSNSGVNPMENKIEKKERIPSKEKIVQRNIVKDTGLQKRENKTVISLRQADKNKDYSMLSKEQTTEDVLVYVPILNNIQKQKSTTAISYDLNQNTTKINNNQPLLNKEEYKCVSNTLQAHTNEDPLRKPITSPTLNLNIRVETNKDQDKLLKTKQSTDTKNRKRKCRTATGTVEININKKHSILNKDQSSQLKIKTAPVYETCLNNKKPGNNSIDNKKQPSSSQKEQNCVSRIAEIQTKKNSLRQSGLSSTLRLNPVKIQSKTEPFKSPIVTKDLEKNNDDVLSTNPTSDQIKISANNRGFSHKEISHDVTITVSTRGRIVKNKTIKQKAKRSLKKKLVPNPLLIEHHRLPIIRLIPLETIVDKRTRCVPNPVVTLDKRIPRPIMVKQEPPVIVTLDERIPRPIQIKQEREVPRPIQTKQEDEVENEVIKRIPKPILIEQEIKQEPKDEFDFKRNLKKKNKDDVQKYFVNGLYRCIHCPYTAKIKSYLKDHLVVHRPKEDGPLFKCNHCTKFESKYRSAYNIHMAKHRLLNDVNKKILHCDAHGCTYQTFDRWLLKKHTVTHLSFDVLPKYECHVCDFNTKYKLSIEKHVLRHKTPEEITMYKCDSCSYQSKYKDTLHFHKKILHGDKDKLKIYRCDTCSYKTVRKCHLKRHRESHQKRLATKKIKGENCDIFTKKEETSIISNKRLKEIQDYLCAICGYKSIDKNCLRNHVINVHTDLNTAAQQNIAS